MAHLRNARNRGGLLELGLVRKAFRVEVGCDPDVLCRGVLSAHSGQWLICQGE